MTEDGPPLCDLCMTNPILMDRTLSVCQCVYDLCMTKPTRWTAADIVCVSLKPFKRACFCFLSLSPENEVHALRTTCGERKHMLCIVHVICIVKLKFLYCTFPWVSIQERRNCTSNATNFLFSRLSAFFSTKRLASEIDLHHWFR